MLQFLINFENIGVVWAYLDNVDVDLCIMGNTESSKPWWRDIVSKSIILAVEWACIADKYSGVSNVAFVGLWYLKIK